MKEHNNKINILTERQKAVLETIKDAINRERIP